MISTSPLLSLPDELAMATSSSSGPAIIPLGNQNPLLCSLSLSAAPWV